MAKRPMIILYVADQNASRNFYAAALNKQPFLDVPGMTEFELNESFLLGLMPEKNIQSILGNATPEASSGNGIPRCELYLVDDDAEEIFKRALKAGAKKVSDMQMRNWGDIVGYCADPDGHILAFAK